MKPLEIIAKYYKPRSKAYKILVSHSNLVTEKALKIAHSRKDLNPDLNFIEEAAMLHDIGIFKTNAPDLFCFGEYPYLCHGYLGCELLTTDGFPEHGLVCERHTGVGITTEEIISNKLPLPLRDFVPESVEEQIICFADKFFSKSGDLFHEKSLGEVRKSVQKFGEKNLIRFNEWCELFL
ncbi:MAG: HD domain-containing protein [Mariniphaga sp.]